YDGGRFVGKIYAKDATINSFAHGGCVYMLRASAAEEFDVLDEPRVGATAAPWARSFPSISEGVALFNKHFAVLPNGTVPYQPHEGRWEVISPATFKLLTANAHAHVGDARRRMAEAWLAAPTRRTLSGIVFDPTKPRLCDVPGTADELPAFNTWPGL